MPRSAQRSASADPPRTRAQASSFCRAGITRRKSTPSTGLIARGGDQPAGAGAARGDRLTQIDGHAVLVDHALDCRSSREDGEFAPDIAKAIDLVAEMEDEFGARAVLLHDIGSG